MDEIAIDAPYTAQACKMLAAGDEHSLNRIKKVVDGERKRLGL